ncbi:MAG: glycosyltransferase [Dongiaceae bacterium]
MTPWLFVDLTTTLEEVGRHPHGTTRVERGIVACLARSAPPDVRFVAWQRAAGRFVEIPAAEAARLATAPAVPDRWRASRPAWLDHPLVVPLRALRRRLLALARRPRRVPVPAPAPAATADPFTPGGVLLIPAEANRQDYAALVRLKREKGLHLVFVFFDLLQVLEDDDPRLADPGASDLPPTDFMVREGALLLAISEFSRGELQRHLRRRGLAGPPVVTLRLAGEVPQGVARAVPGLQPGRFVLSVGDVVARKNHALLLRVWRAWAQAARLPEAVLPLVIAGRIDAEGRPLVADAMADPVLRDLVRFLPNADDEALAWLYRQCRFTVFPSLLEGFGLPVAESLAAGKACLASTASSIPEAGQGAAIGLDPTDAQAWLDAVRRLAGDDAALAAEEARLAGAYRMVSWEDTVADIRAAIAAWRAAEQRP